MPFKFVVRCLANEVFNIKYSIQSEITTKTTISRKKHSLQSKYSEPLANWGLPCARLPSNLERVDLFGFTVEPTAFRTSLMCCELPTIHKWEFFAILLWLQYFTIDYGCMALMKYNIIMWNGNKPMRGCVSDGCCCFVVVGCIFGKVFRELIRGEIFHVPTYFAWLGAFQEIYCWLSRHLSGSYR